MAGIMAFMTKNPVGTGGKLTLFCFNDESYDKLEEEMKQGFTQKEVTEIFKQLRKENKVCIFATVDVDSMYYTDNEAR